MRAVLTMRAPARESRVASIIQFGGWLATAEPGERACYHTGLLMADRQRDGAHAVALIADHVRLVADAGLVTLTQRRWQPGVWDYLAVRTARKARLG